MSDRPEIGSICWNELATPNPKAAKDFYHKVFGWEFTDVEMGDITYSMIKNQHKEFGGLWAIPKDQQKEIPPHWMAYILVESVDKAVENAKKHGAHVIKPTSKAGDFGLFAIITDPTGAHIALWQTLKKK
jgi:predicted enzyme related to lactoylglutathione lyase